MVSKKLTNKIDNKKELDNKKTKKNTQTTVFEKQIQKLTTDYKKLLYTPDSKDDVFDVLEEIEKIKKLNPNQNDIYPSIYDPNFSSIINKKKEFSSYKIPKRKKDIEKIYKLDESYLNDKKVKTKTKKQLQEQKAIQKQTKKVFALSPTQNFLRNFISPNTQYKSLLIIHGTGVGKTCSAITIAEQFKHIVEKNGKKICIIRSKEFLDQLYEENKIYSGNPENQCTGMEYLNLLNDPELVEQCQETGKECSVLKLRLKKIRHKYYDFYEYETWAKTTESYITKVGKKISPEESLNYKIKMIRKKFSDSVIIIDEAHHLNSAEGSDNSRKIIRILTDVLMYSNNLRLILLTATPMFDKASHIVSLINFLLINDKRAPIRQKLFDEYENLLPGATNIIKDKTRGYISFLRGNNPIDFPLRLSAKINFPDKILDLKKYPKIPDMFSNYGKEPMKLMEIVKSPMGKHQKKIYNKYMSDNLVTKGTWITESSISNFVYSSLSEAKNDISLTYGSEGFNNIVKPQRRKNTSFQFQDEEYGKRFLGKELYDYSSKIGTMMDIIKKSVKKGPIFIYSQFIGGGIIPLLIALEMNGFLPYKSHGKPFIQNKYKNPEYLGDYITKIGSGAENNPVNPTDTNNYIKMRQSMIQEKNVKIFIGSAAASEGFSLYGYREVHILEAHFNLSQLDQAIGRTIRRGSHEHLPLKDRNVTVYHYASTLPTVETIDLYKYRLSERKAMTSGIIQKILKENSVDCYLNKNGNIYDDKTFPQPINIETSQGKKLKYSLADQSFTRECDYMGKCSYKCNDESKDESDSKSYIIENIERDIESTILKIIELIKINYRLKISELSKILNISKTEVIDIAINKIIDGQKRIRDSNNNLGKVERVNEYLIFLPLNYKNIDIDFHYQYLKDEKTVGKDIDLKNYITHLKNKLKKELKKKTYNYEDTLENIEKTFKIIKFQTMQKKYNIKMNDLEIIYFVVHKLLYSVKLEFIGELVMKLIKKTDLNTLEKQIVKCIDFNIVRLKDLYIDSSSNEIYGFIIGNNTKILLYSYNKDKDEMELDSGNNKKITESKRMKLDKVKQSNIYGFLKYESLVKTPSFKVMDNTVEEKKSRKGITCQSIVKQKIQDYLNLLEHKKINNKQKITMCNDLELLFLRYSQENKNNSKWFYNIEEYLLVE
jgi:hypothetical protein